VLSNTRANLHSSGRHLPYAAFLGIFPQCPTIWAVSYMKARDARPPQAHSFQLLVMLIVERPANPHFHHTGALSVRVSAPTTYHGFIQHSIEIYRGKLTEYVP
jgi:hypothetical protein